MKQDEKVYGVHPVLELLRSDQTLCRKIFLLGGRQENPLIEEIRQRATARNIPIVLVERHRLDEWAGSIKHQGVLCLFVPSAPLSLASLLDKMADRPPFLLVLDGVEDPMNLGAIVRTADAVGVDGLIIPRRRAAGLTSVVMKASAGALAHVAVAQVTNISQALDLLKKEGIWTVGLDRAASMSYLASDFRLPIAMVVGGEAGLHQKVRERCDWVVSLPMRGQVDSLNVSVAVGVVAYEVLRQRGLF